MAQCSLLQVSAVLAHADAHAHVTICMKFRRLELQKESLFATCIMAIWVSITNTTYIAKFILGPELTYFNIDSGLELTF